MIRPEKRYPGSKMTLTAVFETDAGVATDPTTVVLKTYDPYGQKVTYTYGTDSNLSRVTTGQYAALITPNSAGRWFIRWEGDGVVVNEDNFNVISSKFVDELSLQDYT